jgi:hypothetical protein
MKVYLLVEETDHEGGEVLGVYATRESAEAAATILPLGKWVGDSRQVVEEWEVQ